MKNYYAILSIAKSASVLEVKRAYRKLAMQHHPDRGGTTKGFQEVNEAHSVLSDAKQRLAYDEQYATHRSVYKTTIRRAKGGLAFLSYLRRNARELLFSCAVLSAYGFVFLLFTYKQMVTYPFETFLIATIICSSVITCIWVLRFVKKLIRK